MNVSKKSLIEGLSYALDIAEGSYFSHSKHVAYTSVLIGKSLNLSNERLSELYYVALLHDIGADEHYNIKNHSEVGARTAERLNLSQNSIDTIKYHHEYSNGTGINGLTNDEIPLMAKIILLANLLDLKIQEYKKTLSEDITFEMHHGLIDHLNTIKHLVDPTILEHLLKIINQPYFLLSYLNIRHNDILEFESKKFIDENFDYDDVLLYAEAFSEIIDQRNSFTHYHSKGLADLIRKVCKALGYNQQMINEMHIAGLLHDIGKLAISNDVINKNGKLTKLERFQINKHTYFTRFVLTHIKGFENITEWASNHHERLDGSGYPFGYDRSILGEQERLMAILDIYQALTEERPYRRAFEDKKVWLILEEEVKKNKLDGNLLSQVKAILEK